MLAYIVDLLKSMVSTGIHGILEAFNTKARTTKAHTLNGKKRDKSLQTLIRGIARVSSSRLSHLFNHVY